MMPKIPTKSPIDQKDYSVYHHKDFGPGFFNGFIIKDNCHQNFESYVLNSDLLGPKSHLKGYVPGQTFFKVKEIEVF